MNPAVAVEAFQRIGARCTPLASAAEAAGRVAEPFGIDASLTEGMDWEFWAHMLDHRHDAPDQPPMQSWKRRAATHLAAWPPATVRQALAVHAFWESEYVRLIGCYQRAAELEHLSPVSAADHDLLVAYRGLMDAMWDDCWWHLGWLGRWVRHARRSGVPW